MTKHPEFRKVALGVNTSAEMYALFGRYNGAPFNEKRMSGELYAGEWFEVDVESYDTMLEVMPPAFYRGGMFAMSERKAGNVTMVFCAIPIDGRTRWFGGYCDLSIPGAPDELRRAIIARETADDANTPRRDEKLEAIWNAKHSDFRGFAGSVNPAAWPENDHGKRTIVINGGGQGTILCLLEHLSDQHVDENFRPMARVLVEA